jgi:NAD(P)-dependent dehydrogenase (short-subunit alcohol dehydrogenase family)
MAESVTLVTGASGFLGKAVMKLLAENSQRAIGLDPRPSVTTQVVNTLSDRPKLKALLATEKISHIIHAGGVSGPMVLADDPAEVIAINVLGSLNLLYAALENGVGTFVYCSSAAALGNFYEDEPVDEQYPLRPNNTYSASKAAMEMVLRGLWGKVPIDLCSLRFTVIYGPGRETTFTVEEIVRAALAGKSACIQPMTDWPYVYIDDAARAAVEACFSKSRKQLSYFIAHPEKVTPDDIAAAAAAAGKPVRLEIDAASQGRAGSTRHRACCARFRVSRASRSSRRDSPNDRGDALARQVADLVRGFVIVAHLQSRGGKYGSETCRQTALVTGGSKGIGRAAAEILAGEGCNVIIVSRSSDTLAAAKSAIVQKSNVRVDTVAADLSDSTKVNELARDYPDIDILVNNAGAIPGGSLLNVDEATWRKAWDLKVFGYVNMCRAFYALMQKRKRGVIVNVVGNAADTHDPEYICGVAGNAALAAFTQSLGSVSARDGIRVVAINPGPVATDRLVSLMKRKARDRTGSEDNWKDLLKPLPFGRGATAEEIGAAIAFIASDHSGYTSGSVVTIDAGLSARAQAF